MLHRIRAALSAVILIAGFLYSSLGWAAEPPAEPAPPASAEPAPPGPGEPEHAPASPRAAVSAYLDLGRNGDFQGAAKYLDVPAAERARAPELAERLKRVLDRHSWLDMSTLSPSTEGHQGDNLAHNVDEIATIPMGTGRPESVRLVRVPDGNGVRWVFSRATVARIDAWYDQLEHKWLYEHMPPFLLRSGPAELMLWQWLALPIALLVAWLLGMVLGRLSRGGLARLAHRTKVEWDDALIERLNGPLTLGWTFIVLLVLIPWLALYAPAEQGIQKFLRAGLFFTFFWALMRALGVASALLAASPWATEHPASRSLIPLGSRVSKVVLFAMAVVAMLAQLGYPVASLIAGLGIGGLAVALAAQKTVENLFGAFSIGVDQPFREGDFVRIEDFVGTVEAIGLRSTRIRTLDRTLISMPNGKLADMRLESFTARERIRLHCKLGLVYQTTADQMRSILADLEGTLREHPKLWPNSLTVRFEAFGASSLDIEIMAWFETQDFDEFKLIRQMILLDFMGIVERHGSSFAFPTRTVHLASAPQAEEAPPEKP